MDLHSIDPHGFGDNFKKVPYYQKFNFFTKEKRPRGAKKCKSLTKWKNLTYRKNCYNHIFQHMRPLDTYISSQRVKITRKNIKHEILEKVTELE